MASGTIQMTSSKAWRGRIEWSSTTSLSENCSYISATVYSWKTDGYNTSGGGYFTGSLDIGSESAWISFEQQNKDEMYVTSLSNVRVYHNDDGTGSVNISCSITKQGSGTSLAGHTLSGSETVSLDRIARYATINSAPNFTDEENPTITYSNPAGKGAVKLKGNFSIDGVSIFRDLPKKQSSYTFEFTSDEKARIYNATKTVNSIECTFFVGSAFSASESETWYSLKKTLTIVNANPVINPVIEDVNAASIAQTGDKNTIIKNISTASVNSGAAGIKGATLESQTITNGSQKISAGSGQFIKADSNVFEFTVKDSRGNTATKTVTKKVIDYIPLTCNLDSYAELTGETTAVIHINATGNYFNGSFGINNNTLKVWYRYKKGNEAYSEWILMNPTISGDSYSATVDLPSIYYLDSYTVQVSAADAFNSDLRSAEKVLRALPVFDWSGDDFNFNVPVNFAKGATGVEASGGAEIEQIKTDVTTLKTTVDNMKPKVDGMQDYIIASGFDGGWTWRKWNNGWAEGWYYHTFDLPCDTAWGNVQSTSANFIAPIPYPFSFRYTPCVTIGYENINGDYWIATHTPKGKTTQTPAFQAIRGTAYSSLQVRIHIHVCGDWK